MTVKDARGIRATLITCADGELWEGHVRMCFWIYQNCIYRLFVIQLKSNMYTISAGCCVPIYHLRAMWLFCIAVASPARLDPSLWYERWLLGLETRSWKCNGGQKVYSSVGTILNCSRYRPRGEGLYMWLRSCSGTNWRVYDGFLWLLRYAPFTARGYWANTIRDLKVECIVWRNWSISFWQSMHSYGQFATALYQGVVVRGSGMRAIV